MANELQIKNTVVYTTRPDVLDALRQELKAVGFDSDHIKVPATAVDCLTELEALPQALIVLDWEAGAPDVLKILAANLKRHKIDARPVFLIAAKVDAKIVAAGTEYGVAQVHVGEISRDRIKTSIQMIMGAIKKVQPIRDALIEVAQLRENNDWTAATTKLEELTQANTGNLRLTAELAENYMQASQWEKALTLLESISTAAAEYPRALHLLGRCLMKLGRSEEAAKILQQAKIINPFNVERLLDLGDVLVSMDKAEEARENFDEALQFAPGSAAAKKGLGACKLLEGDINEALEILNEISSGHELASVFNTAAVVSIRNSRFDEGMKLYEAAVKAVEKHPVVMSRLYYNMGIGFHRWERPEEALQCFRQAVTLDPEFKNAKFNADVLSRNTPAAAKPATETASPAKTTATETAATTSLEIIGEDQPGDKEIVAGEFDEDLTDKTNLDLKVA